MKELSHEPEPFTSERWRTLATTRAVLWITAPDGSATHDNASWAAFTGQKHEEYVGWGWLNAIHPDDRQQIGRQWKASVEREEPLTMLYRLRRHDGQYRIMSAEGTPLRIDGRVKEWIGYCIDVTESMEIQAALRASERRLRVLDQLGEVVRVLTDPAQIMAVTARMLGEHLQVSRCAYADVEPDNDTFTIRRDWTVEGVTSSSGVYSVDALGPRAAQTLRAGEYLVINDVERELADEGGTILRALGVQATICAPLVKEGKLVAMMGVHHSTPRTWRDEEVTLISEVVERSWAHIERVRYAAMLEEQDRRKDQFLATLAHELRNPLAPMRYAMSIMRTVPAGAPASVQAQGILERQLGFMSRLIDDLLDLSRINRGLIELKREQISLASVIEQAIETSRQLIDSARHSLDVKLPPASLMIDADRARMVQVISNLLNNAAKYTPDGGHIRIAAWQDGTRAIVEVSDNGIGIPPDQQARLFEMFSQLPHTASRSQGGLGIGLALVRTLVQMHGGQIRAFSAGLDVGSTFTVELPAIVGSGEATRAHPVSKPVRPNTTIRVLVVEDNHDGLMALMMLLELMGFEAQGAADGEAGLEMAGTFKPDIAILDLGLPRMDGLALARALRANPELAGLKLVALTGWGAAQDRARTQEAGFDHHLTKPVEPQHLQDLLTQLAAEVRGNAGRQASE